jgi:hypothetical protein
MFKIILLLWAITFSVTGHAQNPVWRYKKKADSVLLKYFDSTLLGKIKMDDNFWVENKNGNSDGFSYSKAKYNRIAFSEIGFRYSFFVPELNTRLFFNVYLNKDYSFKYDSMIPKWIPACIRAAKPCGFITSDSAKKIAVKDSVAYSYNLKVLLEHNRLDGAYYWTVTGREIQRPKKRIVNGKVYIQVPVKICWIMPYQYRYINAITGAILDNNNFRGD